MMVSIKNTKQCGFCKFWYDPTNSAIRPSNSGNIFWELDTKIKNKCLKKGTQKFSSNTCNEYVCKIEY